MCVHVCAHVCPGAGRCLWRSGKGIRSPGAGVIGGCETANKGVGTEFRSSARAVSALQGSLCSPGCRETCPVDQAGLELIDTPT